jgi:hypothetical protein
MSPPQVRDEPSSMSSRPGGPASGGASPKAERAGSRPRSDSGLRRVIAGAVGAEPLAECLSGCAARAAAASRRAAEPQPMAAPDDQSRGRHRDARAARLEPSPARQRQAPTGAGQRGRGALSGPRPASRSGSEMRPAAVTAATAKTPLSITCPRRGPEPAAVTAKTAGMGLEITSVRKRSSSDPGRFGLMMW